jgi:hypothetical protein
MILFCPIQAQPVLDVAPEELGWSLRIMTEVAVGAGGGDRDRRLALVERKQVGYELHYPVSPHPRAGRRTRAPPQGDRRRRRRHLYPNGDGAVSNGRIPRTVLLIEDSELRDYVVKRMLDAGLTIIDVPAGPV